MEEQGRKTIIGIDDVSDVLMMVKAALKDKYNFIGFCKPEEAMSFFSKRSADLILLDIEMPEANGFSILEEIRKTPNNEAVPVMFLSGHSDKTYREAAEKAGAVDFLLKPIDFTELLEKVEKYIAY